MKITTRTLRRMIAEELKNLDEATFMASDGYEEEYDGPGEGHNTAEMSYLNTKLFSPIVQHINQWKLKAMSDQLFKGKREQIESMALDLQDAIADFRDEEIGGFLGFGGKTRAEKYGFTGTGTARKPGLGFDSDD